MWPFSRPKAPAPVEASVERPDRRESSTSFRPPAESRALIARAFDALDKQPYQPAAFAMDDAAGSEGFVAPRITPEVPEALLAWYASQSFIGYPMCAIMAQHWLIDKACTMPARDAARMGFKLLTYTADPAAEVDPKIQAAIEERLRREDRRLGLNRQMVEFVRLGRVYGLRIAIFRIKGKGPEFYSNPFNIDGVGDGEYEGISQIDPQWCAPLLSEAGASDPASPSFYEPEWWLIRGVKYHRSHLVIFRNGELPDILRPSYMYGGISVPQRIYERVYGAERTANEAPQLAMTKRTNFLKTDMSVLMADQDKAINLLKEFAYYRDNYGTKLIDSDDEFGQHDVSLADLDTVIMSQYQIVAAAAGVPAVKLLGTSPKGFNASGGYEESSYHEELETIQSHDLQPLVNRHHELVMRSEIEPAIKLAAGTYRVEVEWNPVDSPSAKEVAEINKINADADNVLVQMGAIDGLDVRNRLRADSASGYSDISSLEDEETEPGGENDLLGGIV